MSLKLRKVNAEVRDPESEEMIPAGLLGSDALSTIEQAKEDAIEAVEDKGAETLESIPDDYSALSGSVGDLKTQLNIFSSTEDFDIDITDAEAGKQYAGLPDHQLSVTTSGATYRGIIPLIDGVDNCKLTISISEGYRFDVRTVIKSSNIVENDSGWKLNDYTINMESGYIYAIMFAKGYPESGEPLTKQEILDNLSVYFISDLLDLFNTKTSEIKKSIPFVNVKDFGAIGDGLNDDTLYIQSALESVKNSGGTIYIPKGVYLINTLLFNADVSYISSALHIYDNTTLLLDNGATLLRGANVNHIIYTHNENTATLYNGAKNITIRGGVIDGNDTLDSNNTPVNISHGFNIKVEDVTFKGTPNNRWHYIEINSSKNVKIIDCNFLEGGNAEDIQIDAAISGAGNIGISDGTICEDIEIDGCYFNSGAHYAIGNHSDYNHHNIKIHDCIFYNENTGNGAISFISSTEKVDVYNCTFYKNNKGAYFANSQGQNTFHDNRLENVTTICENAIAYDNMVDGIFVRGN